MSQHNWVASRLGHGEVMCSKCYITNREAAVLGKLNHCNIDDDLPTDRESKLKKEKKND